MASWLKGDGWPNELIRRKSHLDATELDHRVLDRPGPITDSDVPDADVIIATWWLTAEWVAALSDCKGAKVYFIQGYEIYDYLPEHRCRATYKLPFHKIVTARWLKRLMDQQYGDTIVDVVHNSVDRKQFFAPKRGKQFVPTIGFLYSAAHVKGLDLTLEALRVVRTTISELRLISFGNQLPIPRLPLPDGTEFHHLPPQNEIRNLYARCDAWLTASRSEGFNLPALEAMACRTPVISTRTGWPEEAISSGYNGILVDVDDINDLAQGVRWVISRSDHEWRALSENAYATASIGSWQASTKAFEDALRHACMRSVRGEVAGKCTFN